MPPPPVTASAVRETARAASPSLRMVRARRNDMSRIAGFIRSSADWYREFLDPKDMAEHEVDETWEEKNFTRREFYLGHAPEGAVGTISLQDFGGFLYLGYVYLDVDHVGKGYGRDLLDFAARQARRRGKRGLVLIAHPAATWAVKAYEKFGFERIAAERSDVLAWNQGALKPYYEEGFHLYCYRV